ncbi:MAG: hypothetical protein WCV84_01150 [Patescibacteria group bacterium]
MAFTLSVPEDTAEEIYTKYSTLPSILRLAQQRRWPGIRYEELIVRSVAFDLRGGHGSTKYDFVGYTVLSASPEYFDRMKAEGKNTPPTP